MLNTISNSKLSRAYSLVAALLLLYLFTAGTTCKKSEDDTTGLFAALALAPASAAPPASSGPSCALLSGTIQGSDVGCALNLSAAVTTFAGDGTSATTDGVGTAAQFQGPVDVTTDGTNLYVADKSGFRIRKIEIASKQVTILAGKFPPIFMDGTGTNAGFSDPFGLTTDGTNLYVVDDNRIRRIAIATAEVTTLAGGAGTGFVDATGTVARFDNPVSIVVMGDNLYVADDLNHRIRKIVIATGVVTTLAGSTSGHNDAAGAAAQFNRPMGLTTDGTNLYVADRENHRIRRVVIATGEVTTMAGDGTMGLIDGIGTAARFNRPTRLTTDGTNLYVSSETGQVIRKIVIADGTVTTLAGSTGGFNDATGTAAQFQGPLGMTVHGSKLYVADNLNFRIRAIE